MENRRSLLLYLYIILHIYFTLVLFLESKFEAIIQENFVDFENILMYI